MRYPEYYCNRRHHSLVVEILNETYIKQRSLLVQQNIPYKSCSSLHLWNDAPIFILVVPLTWSNSLFYTAFLRQPYYFFSLTCEMVGHFTALLLSSFLRHCLQFELEHNWPGKSRHCTCVGESHCPVCAAWGRGAASSVHENDWRFSDTPWLWLVVLIRERSSQTADLYPILLSHHNDNFSRYNKKQLQTTTLIKQN